MLKLILPLIVIFLIYNFVNHIAGIIALVVFLAAYAVINLPTFYMLRGNSKFNKGDRSGGLALMEKAYKTGRLNIGMAVFYAYNLIRENRDEKALTVLDEIIESGKGQKADICRAKHDKAIALRKLGREDEAFALMKETHEAMPATDSYGTLGLMYTEKAKADPSVTEEALAFAKEAYDYNSDDRTIADNMAEMYILTGRRDEAEEIYKGIIQTKPAGPTPYYKYARLLMEKGDYENAEDMLNRSLRYPFTGVTAVKRSDVEEALKTVEERLTAQKLENLENNLENKED